MQINNMLGKLEYYLNYTKPLVLKLPLKKPLYKEGTTIGQVTYHTAQSANYWLKLILKQPFKRDREDEFKRKPTKTEIIESIDLAIACCEELKKKDLDWEEKLDEPITVGPDDFVVDTVLAALIHITSHTAEHYGEISIIESTNP